MRYLVFSLSYGLAIHCLFLQHSLARNYSQRGKNMVNVALINTAMSLNEVAAFVVRLRMANYKVNDFGRDGWTVEIDGMQIFRATNMGNERFMVAYDERIFPDV